MFAVALCLQKLMRQLQHGTQLPVKLVGPVGGLKATDLDGVSRVILYTGGVGVSGRSIHP